MTGGKPGVSKNVPTGAQGNSEEESHGAAAGVTASPRTWQMPMLATVTSMALPTSVPHARCFRASPP